MLIWTIAVLPDLVITCNYILYGAIAYSTAVNGTWDAVDMEYREDPVGYFGQILQNPRAHR